MRFHTLHASANKSMKCYIWQQNAGCYPSNWRSFFFGIPRCVESRIGARGRCAPSAFPLLKWKAYVALFFHHYLKKNPLSRMVPITTFFSGGMLGIRDFFYGHNTVVLGIDYADRKGHR